MIELATILTVLNIADKGKGLYDWITGVSQGDQLKKTLLELEKTKGEVKRLSDLVLWAPTQKQALNLGHSNRSEIQDPRQVLAAFESFVQDSKAPALVTTISQSPARLRAAFEHDPFEVLFDPRPAHRVKRPNDPDLVPILFNDGSQKYIGWQKKGVLPSLFECDLTYLPVSRAATAAGSPPSAQHTAIEQLLATSRIAKTLSTKAEPKRKPAPAHDANGVALSAWYVVKGGGFLAEDFHLLKSVPFVLATLFSPVEKAWEQAENKQMKGTIVLGRGRITLYTSPEARPEATWLSCTAAELSSVARPWLQSGTNQLEGIACKRSDATGNGRTVVFQFLSNRDARLLFEEWIAANVPHWLNPPSDV